MTTNPKLPNHLIRELMHIIRLKSDGDAMVRLALSGRETFPVFEYVVETAVTVATDRHDSFFQSLASTKFAIPTPLNFGTGEIKRFVVRYVRRLTVKDIPFEQLSLGTITHLTVECYVESLTSILNSWIDLENLKIKVVSDQLFTQLIGGTISLPKLRKLDIRLTFEQFFELMSTTSRLPLPENVTFNIDVKKDSLVNVVPFQPFPNVKHFVANMEHWPESLMSEKFHRIKAAMQSLTGLETAALNFTYFHESQPTDVDDVINFHECIRNTKFLPALEINVAEYVDIIYVENEELISSKLKSLGFEEGWGPRYFIIKKDYDRVELNHDIEHYEAISDTEEETSSDEDDSMEGASSDDYDMSDNGEVNDDDNVGDV